MKHQSKLAIAFVLSLVSSGFGAGVEVGEKAPDFAAKGVDGKDYTLKTTSDAKVTVVCFTCNRCPVAVAYEDRFIEFASQYKEKGVEFVAINVNPESVADMKKRAEEKGFPFAYAKDESGESARAYGARVTPHIFVLNEKRELAYVGAFDDNVNESKVEKKYVINAVDQILAGKEVTTKSTRPVGCGIRLPRN